jgi:glycine/D-amino acid oxidase-like deaminating enzyme
MTSANPALAHGFKTTPWWWEAAEPPTRDSVLPDRAGVAVVGGGYAGLSAALTLRRLGHDVTVLDAERIGWGASSRNGGMVSGGLKVASGALAKTYGADRARAIALAAAASFPLHRGNHRAGGDRLRLHPLRPLRAGLDAEAL